MFVASINELCLSLENQNTENMNINELIDFNLNLLKEGLDIFALELRNINNKILDDEKSLALFNKMISESLIFTDQYKRIQLSTGGYEILNNGGWLKYITDNENEKTETAIRNKLKETLEIDLAKSNLEANELNRKIAKQNKENEKKNRVSTWVNIIIGLLNFLALIWQILKAE